MGDGGCVLGMSMEWGWGNFHQPGDHFHSKQVDYLAQTVHTRERKTHGSVNLSRLVLYFARRIHANDRSNRFFGSVRYLH